MIGVVLIDRGDYNLQSISTTPRKDGLAHETIASCRTAFHHMYKSLLMAPYITRKVTIIHISVDACTSRLTIVNREAKKKQAVCDE